MYFESYPVATSAIKEMIPNENKFNHEHTENPESSLERFEGVLGSWRIEIRIEIVNLNLARSYLVFTRI